MCGDRVTASRFEVADRRLEAVVTEGLDLAAPVADEVVVVALIGPDRFEPGDTVAELQPLEQTFFRKRVENAVHAREAHRLP